MNRGKLLILLMIAAGVAAGGLKVWRHNRHMHQVLQNLSPRVVQLIAEAPQTEVLRLTPLAESEGADEETLEIEGRAYRIAGRKNVVGAKGLAEVRDRLVDDASYRWEARIESDEGDWRYVLQFTDGEEQARLAFDIPNETRGTVKLMDDGRTLDVDPIADGLATFFAAQFKESKATQ